MSTGTHPCGSPSRQDDGETRAPALHTLDDVLRFRGDEEYRAVLLHPSSTCSCLRSGRSWEYVHIVIDCTVCLLDSCHDAEAVRCTGPLHVVSVRLQVIPELMSVCSPPVTTPVMLNMSCTRGAISTSAVVLLSGMREEVFALSDLQAWWSLTRGFDQLSHNAGDFLLRGDAQRNSTRNLGPSAGNFVSPCTCENWHQPSKLACLL